MLINNLMQESSEPSNVYDICILSKWDGSSSKTAAVAEYI